MKKLVLLGLVTAVAAFAVWFYWGNRGEASGASAYVLFDRTHDISAGDPVTLKGQEVGRVEAVEPEGRGIRVKIRFPDDEALSVPSGSTFKVEGGWLGGRRLAGYVLDPESPPLEDGASIEGADSTPELLFRQGQRKVARALDEFQDSEWFRKSERLMEDVESALEDIDWEELGEEMRADLKRMSQDLAALAGQTENAARDGYRKLKPEIEKLIRELEALGKSREAEELRRHLEDLLALAKDS